jgi:hypothetical protein
MELAWFCLFKSENRQGEVQSIDNFFPQAVIFAEKDGISGRFCYFCNPKPGM